MICSECGGNVMSVTYSVYYADGHSSGYHKCNKCSKTKGWRREGSQEQVINMSKDE